MHPGSPSHETVLPARKPQLWEGHSSDYNWANLRNQHPVASEEPLLGTGKQVRSRGGWRHLDFPRSPGTFSGFREILHPGTPQTPLSSDSHANALRCHHPLWLQSEPEQSQEACLPLFGESLLTETSKKSRRRGSPLVFSTAYRRKALKWPFPILYQDSVQTEWPAQTAVTNSSRGSPNSPTMRFHNNIGEEELKFRQLGD